MGFLDWFGGKKGGVDDFIRDIVSKHLMERLEEIHAEISDKDGKPTLTLAGYVDSGTSRDSRNKGRLIALVKHREFPTIREAYFQMVADVKSLRRDLPSVTVIELWKRGNKTAAFDDSMRRLIMK